MHYSLLPQDYRSRDISALGSSNSDKDGGMYWQCLPTFVLYPPQYQLGQNSPVMAVPQPFFCLPQAALHSHPQLALLGEEKATVGAATNATTKADEAGGRDEGLECLNVGRLRGKMHFEKCGPNSREVRQAKEFTARLEKRSPPLRDWVEEINVWELAKAHKVSSEFVQAAFEEADNEQTREILANGLRGHVNQAWQSKHAIFVLEKCISVMTPSQVQFVCEEMLAGECVIKAARHKQGVRVHQRLYEHGLELKSPPDSPLLRMVEQLIDSCQDLASGVYGNLALQSILERGTQEMKIKMLHGLRVCTQYQQFSRMAKHPYATRVLQRAIELCSGVDFHHFDEFKLRFRTVEDKTKQMESFVIKAITRWERNLKPPVQSLDRHQMPIYQ